MLLNTGVDIVSIERFNKIVKDRGERFIKRIFTKTELNYCAKKIRKIRHLAARFACKEAVSKALKMNWNKGLNWKNIEVINARNGAPLVKLSGQAKDAAKSLKIKGVEVSLSHCNEYAVATAVIMKKN